MNGSYVVAILPEIFPVKACGTRIGLCVRCVAFDFRKTQDLTSNAFTALQNGKIRQALVLNRQN